MRYYWCRDCEVHNEDCDPDFCKPCFKRVKRANGDTKTEINEQLGAGWETLPEHCSDAIWKVISVKDMMLEMMLEMI